MDTEGFKYRVFSTKDMKRLLFISVVCVLLFSVIVTAKCGDRFCDPDEDCQFCSDDCLCSLGLETRKPSECCAEFDCKECEDGYCENRKCSSLKSFRSMLEIVECNSNGSVHLQINFHLVPFGSQLAIAYIDANDEIKVFMKSEDKESTFKEIKGIWKSKDFNSNYPNRLKEEASFNSDLNVFDKKGKYWVRVKFLAGRTNNFYEDYLVSCPEIIKEEGIKVEEEPEEEIVEETKIEEEIISEELKKQIQEIIDEPKKKGFFKRIIDYFISLFS